MPQYLSREEQGLPAGDPDVERAAAERGEEVAAQEQEAVEDADGAPQEDPAGGLADAPSASQEELEAMSKEDLLRRAGAAGVPVSAAMTKAEIIERLQ